MKLFYILLMIPILFFTECTYKTAIKRETKPRESYDLQSDSSRAVYQGTEFEVTAEIIDNKFWEHILESDAFENKKGGSAMWRNPRLTFIHITLKNTGRLPVEAGDIILNFGEHKKKPITAKQIKKKYKSPAYSAVSFKSLFQPRRIIELTETSDKIDFDLDSVEYKLNFIKKGDIISKIVAFDWVPVQYRTFYLTVQIKSGDNDRTVKFTFDRFEYREEGPFSKPEKEYDDEL